MEFKPHLFKSWFTLEEVQRLLKNNYHFDYSYKEIIKILSNYPHIIEILFYAEYHGETNQLILGKKEQPFGKLKIKKNPIFPAEDLIKIYDKLCENQETVYQSEHSELIVKSRENCPYIDRFKGFFFVPEFSFDKFIFNFSDDDTLILPETGFYDPYDFFKFKRKDRFFPLKFRPDFLFMEFNAPFGQGVLELADLYLHADDFSYIANLFEYENEQRAANKTKENEEQAEQSDTLQPPKTEENLQTHKKQTKNSKSSKILKLKGANSGKKFYLESILQSCETTAKAHPNEGVYAIIEAVLTAFSEKYNLSRTDNRDFYNIESYAQKLRKRGLNFPDNRGIKGGKITAVIELAK
ncbi:hypothetical protein BKK51_12460 [Rodentibacter trehalosifermentans]|uniref:Uncharacterized protein n=1 Tax=Rodentibacter trehalosifermentans TaxID=1908263 RepID=A0A1V3IMK0_9PAST|nr:hypothetical protein [Rodentibacter trehalosifermentans]OOF42798.1 hypothetical protein BKK51_12460 [Rodentibacter trehalosifermentans]